MITFRNLSILGATLLASCASVPKLTKTDTATVSDVVQNVLCEFKAATIEAPFLTQGDGWTAGADLQLQVVNGTLDSLSTKVTMPSHLVPSILVGYTGSADVTRTIGFAVDLRNYDPQNCSGQQDRKSGARLRGKLGIEQWATKMNEAYNDTKVLPNKAGFVVEFIVLKSAAVTPGVSGLPVNASFLEVTPIIGGSRKDLNRLTVAFTKNPSKPKPTEVVIIEGQKVQVPPTKITPRKKIILPETLQKIIPAVPDNNLNRNDRVIQDLNQQQDQ